MKKLYVFTVLLLTALFTLQVTNAKVFSHTVPAEVKAETYTFHVYTSGDADVEVVVDDRLGTRVRPEVFKFATGNYYFTYTFTGAGLYYFTINVKPQGSINVESESFIVNAVEGKTPITEIAFGALMSPLFLFAIVITVALIMLVRRRNRK